MNKDEWIAVAAAKLRPYLDEKTDAYAASLYETYGSDDEWAVDPEGAVAEDMSYWDGELG